MWFPILFCFERSLNTDFAEDPPNRTKSQNQTERDLKEKTHKLKSDKNMVGDDHDDMMMISTANKFYSSFNYINIK